MRYRPTGIDIGTPIEDHSTFRYLARLPILGLCAWVASLCSCSLPEDEAAYPYAGWTQIDSVVECYQADYAVADEETTLCRWDCAHMGDGIGHKITAIWSQVDGCWSMTALEVGNCDGFFDAKQQKVGVQY